MFEFYNKDVVTEAGGTMRIIGDRYSKLCLLKDKDGPLYAGSFCDCEYVAAAVTEAKAYRDVALHFDRMFLPSCDKYAVRSITPTMGSFKLSVKYEAPNNWVSDICYCLRKLMCEKSPYTVTKYTKDGLPTVDRYNKLILHDRREGTGMCVAFTHGIKVLSTGLLGSAYAAVGGWCARACRRTFAEQKAPMPSTMADDPVWAWDANGDVCPSVAPWRDPDLVLGGACYDGDSAYFGNESQHILHSIETASKDSPERVAAVLSHFKDDMLDVYKRAGMDMSVAVEDYFNKVKKYFHSKGIEV